MLEDIDYLDDRKDFSVQTTVELWEEKILQNLSDAEDLINQSGLARLFAAQKRENEKKATSYMKDLDAKEIVGDDVIEEHKRELLEIAKQYEGNAHNYCNSFRHLGQCI